MPYQQRKPNNFNQRQQVQPKKPSFVNVLKAFYNDTDFGARIEIKHQDSSSYVNKAGNTVEVKSTEEAISYEAFIALCTAIYYGYADEKGNEAKLVVSLFPCTMKTASMAGGVRLASDDLEQLENDVAKENKGKKTSVKPVSTEPARKYEQEINSNSSDITEEDLPY